MNNKVGHQAYRFSATASVSIRPGAWASRARGETANVRTDMTEGNRSIYGHFLGRPHKMSQLASAVRRRHFVRPDLVESRSGDSLSIWHGRLAGLSGRRSNLHRRLGDDE
ncbi:unnamed protein product [Protopolystoma xenopodis]|uniref:Uncharacterized protein n=1 Tax=Protopolystoma xenopodis TaxID=117903 RepID=A0A3S5CPI7_9PLAT|nr:unnamed protein product [Protopolystoma xenopodis]